MPESKTEIAPSCTCAGALIETNAHEAHCAIYEVLGMFAPRCPRCGWQALDRPYTEATRAEQEAAATADVVSHKAECSGCVVTPPGSTTPASEDR